MADTPTPTPSCDADRALLAVLGMHVVGRAYPGTGGVGGRVVQRHHGHLVAGAGQLRHDLTEQGLRHTVAMAWSPGARQLYATQNNRDQLDALWKDKFTAEDNNSRPAEELQLLKQGANFGWPYCFYDIPSKKRLLNPEYGGDGRTVGRCASLTAPLYGLPAHRGPNDLLFYTGAQFPARYRGGAFIALHSRANPGVAFLPFAGGRPAGPHEDFARLAAGVDPTTLRPNGLAQGRDGSLYLAEDGTGRLWRIFYTGPR